MKFTTKGYVKLKVNLIKIYNTDAIEFKVIDTGFGIKKEEKDKLFKLFSLLEETKLANESGTGIGLY